MNEKLLALLNQINAQKQKVVDLANDGKLKEAKTAKEELQKMQNKFDLLKDVLDQEPAAELIELTAEPSGVHPVNINKNHAIHEFADAARHYFRNAKANTEGTNADGGYTVPDDIKTEINRYKEARFSMESLVDTESVSTDSGRRTYQSRADHTGFAQVAEGGKIANVPGPTFELLE